MEKVLKQKSGRDTIIYGIVAVLIFGIAFGVTCYGREGEQKNTDARIVMLGDSILGEVRDETSVSSRLSKLLGEPVFNAALGGTCMGRQDKEMRLANTKDCLSMAALAQAIAIDDFGIQQTVRIRENATEYFEEAINELEKVDFESVEILFIGHGINDYHGGIPIYNEDDPYDVYTFTGAMRSAVEILQKKYPDMRIILVTPTYSWYVLYDTPEVTCEVNDLGGGVLEGYVNAEIRLAQSMGVEVIDLYHDFYPHEQWNDWVTYTIDGVHPNEAGRDMIAETIYEYLMNSHMILDGGSSGQK